MIDLDDLERKVVRCKKAAKIDDNSTPSRRRKTKESTTEIKPNEKMTIENSTKKPAGTGKALRTLVIKTKQTSTTKSKPVISFGFDEQLHYSKTVKDHFFFCVIF